MPNRQKESSYESYGYCITATTQRVGSLETLEKSYAVRDDGTPSGQKGNYSQMRRDGYPQEDVDYDPRFDEDLEELEL